MEQARADVLHRLYSLIADDMAKKAQLHVPETETFRKYTIQGHLTGDDIYGLLGVEEADHAGSARCVSMSVFCKGDDRVLTNFLFTGTKQEVLEWLKSADGQREIVDAYIQLEEKLVLLFS